jgi:hypothetical protein
MSISATSAAARQLQVIVLDNPGATVNGGARPRSGRAVSGTVCNGPVAYDFSCGMGMLHGELIVRYHQRSR